MTNETETKNCVNGTGTLSEGVAHGRTGVRCKPGQIVIKRLYQQDKDETLSMRLASVNVGTLRGRSGEILGMLERRDIDICCVQEVRWRIIEGKTASYKLFWK